MKKWKWPFLILFLLFNIIAYNHALRFTHFTEGTADRIRPEELSVGQKMGVLFWGVPNPRPMNEETPSGAFQTVHVESQELLEGWLIEAEAQKGVVILFHGYGGNKSGLLGYGAQFNRFGYSTLLMDFRGSGGSGGQETTIGFKESEDVEAVFEYVKARFPDKEIILFGSSMGAVGILKAIADHAIEPDKLILECPFGYMRTTTRKRFEAMGVPAFPFAEILLFYGGIQNGFNAFAHNPTEYAKAVRVPTLLLYGRKDKRVTPEETDEIFRNLRGPKTLQELPNSGHENYLLHSREEWIGATGAFLSG